MLTSVKYSLITPPGAYEIESPNIEIKRIIIEEGYFTDAKYPFTIKHIFSTLGSNIESSSNITGSQIAFTPDDIIGDILGITPVVLHEKYILSDYSVIILPFNKISIETNIVRVMIFKGRLTAILHNFTIDDDENYKYVENFAGGID